MTAPASSARPPMPGPASGDLRARRSLSVVTENRPLGCLCWLTLAVPGWVGAVPGQFALLQAVDSCCFLGRPLSVARQEGESVSFLIAPIGSGTRELCGLREGDMVWLLGPLGNGFPLEPMTQGLGRTLVVGGGVGVAPFPLLLSTLADIASTRVTAAAAPPLEVRVLLGFRDAAQAAGAGPVAAAAAALEKVGVSCPGDVVAEDGSLGRAEKVTDVLQREIRPGDRLAVCGPWAMTRAVAALCAPVKDVSVWFSVEAGMACGVGSCHGCVVPLAEGGLARVCREGPVFTAEALFGRDLFSGQQGATGEGARG